MSIQVELREDGAVSVVADDIAEFVDHFSSRLSRDGVFLETDRSLPRGRELEVCLGLADGFEVVRGVGMVAWVRSPRPEQSVTGGVGLHLLALTQGEEFIDRLIRDAEERGDTPFSLEQAAPVTPDGSPPEAATIDQMMARRGDKVLDEEIDSEAEDHKSGQVLSKEDEARPEFAPGFGEADLWNQEMRATMPGQVAGWLGSEEESAEESQEEPSEESDEPDTPVPEGSGESLPGSKTIGGPSQDPSPRRSPAGDGEPDPSPAGPVPGPEPAAAPKAPERPADAGEDAPDGASVGQDDVTDEGSGRPAEPNETKAKAARQHEARQHESRQHQSRQHGARSLGKPSSSFLEASRRAGELLSSERGRAVDSAATVRGVDHRQAGAGLSTVAVRPEEMASLVREVESPPGTEQEEANGGSSSSSEGSGGVGRLSGLSSDSSSTEARSSSFRSAVTPGAGTPRPTFASSSSPAAPASGGSAEARPETPKRSPAPSAGPRPVAAAEAAETVEAPETSVGSDQHQTQVLSVADTPAPPKNAPSPAPPLEGSPLSATPDFEYASEDKRPMIVVGVIVAVIVVALVLWGTLS